MFACWWSHTVIGAEILHVCLPPWGITFSCLPCCRQMATATVGLSERRALIASVAMRWALPISATAQISHSL